MNRRRRGFHKFEFLPRQRVVFARDGKHLRDTTMTCRHMRMKAYNLSSSVEAFVCSFRRVFARRGKSDDLRQTVCCTSRFRALLTLTYRLHLLIRTHQSTMLYKGSVTLWYLIISDTIALSLALHYEGIYDPRQHPTSRIETLRLRAYSLEKLRIIRCSPTYMYRIQSYNS